MALVFLIGFNLWVWRPILSQPVKSETAYFLNIGQGDAELAVVPSSSGGPPIKILIDGGKDKKILTALDEVLGTIGDNYIDIVMMTHPDLDHFGGLIEVVKNYDLGLFVSNGKEAPGEKFGLLKQTLEDYRVPTLVLGSGDRINYQNEKFEILSPDQKSFNEGSSNEAGLVIKWQSANGRRVLFTSDIGMKTEDYLLSRGLNLEADILKVGHHGSHYSSGENFVAAVHPAVSVIEVGRNSYGHPTEEALETLQLSGALIYRTDEDGTIGIALSDGGAPAEPSWLATLGAIATGDYGAGSSPNLALSLTALEAEASESKLVSHEKCHFGETKASSTSSPSVVINEVAWMGGPDGTTHEWLELRRLAPEPVDLSGWQLLNENEKINLTFPQGTMMGGSFLLLGRSSTPSEFGIDPKLIFTGAVRNSGESLRLFDNGCSLIDEVLGRPNWPAGDNKTKKTMVRTQDLRWTTSSKVGGTPGADNT